MSDTSNRTDRHKAGTYEIHLKGHLDPRWAARFGVPSLIQQPDGTTLIQGVVVDQSALHGLLQTVRDLGLPLISVSRTDLGQLS